MTNPAHDNSCFKMSENELENIHIDYNNMPECSEKFVLKAIYTLAKRDHVNNSTNNLQFMVQEISSCIENLIERLKVEDLYYENSHIVNSLLKCAEESKLDMALELLISLIHKIRFLSIQEVIRLVNINDQYTKKLQNKNIYILFGLTGTGKSTALHYFAGSTFEIDEMGHLNPTKIINTDLHDIKTSASLFSETRHVIPVEITNSLDGFTNNNVEGPSSTSEVNEKQQLVELKELKNMQGSENCINKTNSQNETSDSLVKNEMEVIICDSPGFGDTRGPEIEISNSITIHRAVNLCSGLKPVILISNQMGDRYEGLQTLTHILFEMIKNPDEILNNFAYIFSKYESNETFETICCRLESLIEEIQQFKRLKKIEIDKSFLRILKDITPKLKRKENVLLLNPFSEENRSNNLKSLCDQNFITSPSKHFNLSLSLETKLKISKQVEQHFKIVERMLIRNEFDLAEYKLNELIQLVNIVAISDIENEVKNKIHSIAESLKKYYKAQTSYLIRKLEQGENSNENDLQEYYKCLENAKSSTTAINNFAVAVKAEYVFNEYQLLKDQILNEVKKLETSTENIKNEDLEDYMSILVRILDNLKLIAEFFQKNTGSYQDEELKALFTDNFQRAKKNIMSKICDYHDQISKLFESEKFELIAEKPTKLKTLIELAIVHLPELSRLNESIRETLEKRFETLAKISIDSILNANPDYKFSDVFEKMEQYDRFFNFANNDKNLHTFIKPEFILTKYQEFLDSIQEFFQQLNQDAIAFLDEEKYNQVYECVKKMNIFRKNKNFSKHIDEYYQEILNKSEEEVKDKRYFIMNALESLQKFGENTNLKMERRHFLNLNKKIDDLNCLSWLKDYKRSSVKYFKINLCNIIDEFIDEINEENIHNIKINDCKSKELDHAHKNIKRIENIMILKEKLDTGLITRIENIKDIFHESIKSKLNLINDSLAHAKKKDNFWNSLDFNFTFFEKSIIFLESCENWCDIDLSSYSKGIHLQIEKYINEKFNEINRKLNEIYEIITKNSEKSNDADLNENFFLDMGLSLRKLLIEIERLTSYSFPNLFNALESKNQRLFNDWIEKLSKKADDIQVQISITIHTDEKISIHSKIELHQSELSSLYKITKALQNTDSLLHGDVSFRKSYIELATYFQKQSNRALNEACRCIETFDLESLEYLLDNFSDDGFKKLSSIFKQNIEKILNLTTKIVYKKDYTKEIVKDILDLFTNCEKSKRVLSKKLKIEFTEIDKKQAEIKDLIEKHIKEYIDEANKHMLKMNFEYAEMKLIPQLNILKPLVYYSIDRDNLEKDIQKLNDREEYLIEIVHEFNSKTETVNYCCSEPSVKDFYEALRKSSTRIFTTPNAISEFKKGILKHYENKLYNVIKHGKSDGENFHLNECMKSLEYLPDDLRLRVKEMIEEAIGTIELLD